MNALIEQGVIQEMICNGNFAYVLSGNESFLPVEYKVLHSKTGDGFVKCVKMSFNGHTQLYYITEGLRPLLSVVSSMNVDGFLTMVTNLLTNVVQAKSNGFLSCQNIEVGFEKIFVEPSTLKVSLVYVPLNRHIHSDYDAFENELRTGLVRLINSLPQITSARVTRLSIALSNGMLGLEDVIEEIAQSKCEDLTQGADRLRRSKHLERDIFGSSHSHSQSKKSAKLVALNGRPNFEIPLTQEDTVLGKNPYAVDVALDYNPAISRVHCKISKTGSDYFLTDLGSANGTFINGVRLARQESKKLTSGDTIRLATSEFRFVVR